MINQTEQDKSLKKRLAVLTSGGDAPGMNAAIRAVVRTAENEGTEAFAVIDGYKGLVEGNIKQMDWKSVGSIIQHGGTVIGAARYKDFDKGEKRREAAFNLVEKEIDYLVIIGGDGTLTGARIFHTEWPELLKELKDKGDIDEAQMNRHKKLTIACIVGSIDNDMSGTDLTIGANTALHRITEAVDAISSTAHSHKRTFVIQVMGRNCGYLALMSGLVTGADWIITPEYPPEAGTWEDEMCNALREGQDMGREARIVILAEGVKDTSKNTIGLNDVVKALTERFDSNVRDIELGHFQRGGSPSGLDRYLSTLLGHRAAKVCLDPEEKGNAKVICIREAQMIALDLEDVLEKNKKAIAALENQTCHQEESIFSNCFQEAIAIEKVLRKPKPPNHNGIRENFSFAVLHCGTPTPGMNAAVRAAVRLGIDKGHEIFGVKRGFEGLINGDFEKEKWMSVNRFTQKSLAVLGSSHKIPTAHEFQHINRNLLDKKINGLLIIGGMSGYRGAYEMLRERTRFDGFKIPIICIPASISNNLPGSELSIGSDTALNNIVEAVDKIKQSEDSTPRCFIVEVAGDYCGYLALMSGIALGAEQVYLHEDGITLDKLQMDLKRLKKEFKNTRRLALMVRNQKANRSYDTNFITALFEEENKGLFEVCNYIIGALQYEGNPSPCDRILAARMANKSINRLIRNAKIKDPACEFIGIAEGKMEFGNLENFPEMIDPEYQRPKKEQLWWLGFKEVADKMSRNPLE